MPRRADREPRRTPPAGPDEEAATIGADILVAVLTVRVSRREGGPARRAARDLSGVDVPRLPVSTLIAGVEAAAVAIASRLREHLQMHARRRQLRSVGAEPDPCLVQRSIVERKRKSLVLTDVDAFQRRPLYPGKP